MTLEVPGFRGVIFAMAAAASRAPKATYPPAVQSPDFYNVQHHTSFCTIFAGPNPMQSQDLWMAYIRDGEKHYYML